MYHRVCCIYRYCDIAYAQDHGMTASQGASLISILSAFNFLGRVVTGYVLNELYSQFVLASQ